MTPSKEAKELLLAIDRGDSIEVGEQEENLLGELFAAKAMRFAPPSLVVTERGHEIIAALLTE